MSFPADFLDEVRARSPMLSVAVKQVKLVKAGRNWKGRCPFHAEKTPSFYVYEAGFHCFACGAHGDPIDFVAQATGCDHDEAVRVLAKAANLPLPGTWQAEQALLASAAVASSPGDGPMVTNETQFSDGQVEALLATAARLLVRQRQVTSASILANGLAYMSHWEHNNWNGGRDTWHLSLAVPATVYFDLDDRKEREGEITAALNTSLEGLSPGDDIFAKIITSLDEDPNWRHKVNQHLSGKGITNQGRVRSDNIAAIERDGLLFRSLAEVRFYDALKRSGVPFAPLSVVLYGSVGRPRRVEPDFIIYKDGVVMIVEIDGDLYHTETPSAAHARLKFLTDEGAKLERINSSACDSPQKAVEAVNSILATIDKLRRSR